MIFRLLTNNRNQHQEPTPINQQKKPTTTTSISLKVLGLAKIRNRKNWLAKKAKSQKAKKLKAIRKLAKINRAKPHNEVKNVEVPPPLTKILNLSPRPFPTMCWNG